MGERTHELESWGWEKAEELVGGQERRLGDEEGSRKVMGIWKEMFQGGGVEPLQ